MSVDGQRFFVGPDDEPDKYRLLRQVGGGGEAELWEADLAFAGGRERVAVKILRAEHAAEVARWRERWAEQAELLRLIRHPGVVGVHAYFEGARLHLSSQTEPNDRALYLVMNWVGGQDLREWVPQHIRPEDRWDALRYLAQVAEVLDWLHSGRAAPSERPVVHGDISPANVVINPDGQAVLVDFGLFRMVRHVTAAPVGTHGYCAPEVLRNGEYSPASDRYAFGGLAYYVLTGIHPPANPQELHAGLGAIAGSAGQQATVQDLAAIFADNPDARPSASEWIRILRLQSTTALTSPSPLPPLAPPGAATWQASAGSPVRRFPTWAAITTTASVVMAALLIVAFTFLPSTAEVAGPGNMSDNRPPMQQSTTPTETQPPQLPNTPAEVPVAAGPLILAKWLVDVDPVEGGESWERGPRDVNGKTYKQSIYVPLTCSVSTAGYNLGRQHKRLSAMIGMADDASADDVIRFIVLRDGQVALTRDLRVGQDAAVDLDVTGVLRLTLKVTSPNGHDCVEGAVWAEPQLFR